MKFIGAISTALLLVANSQAFTPATFGRVSSFGSSVLNARSFPTSRSVPLFASSVDEETDIDAQNGQISYNGSGDNENSKNASDDPEIARLRSMAQQLRAEAAALEAQRQEELASAAQKAFDKFDTNKDGKVSFEELRDGLKRSLKDVDLSDHRVEQLMEKFDASGDGALQPDEFVSVDKFRNQLEQLARDERKQATLARTEAQKEQETAKMLQAVSELINDKPPTSTDKLVSVIPYLFPLLDVLPFGQSILASNPENPAVMALATLFALYKSIPLSGFVAFFALSYLAGDVSINRLIRFNMRQAIYLDIALFFPSLLLSVLGFVVGLGGNEVQLPEAVTMVTSSAVFFSILAAVAYSTVSSLAGATPDKIPFLSNAVKERMPSQDMLIEAAKSGNLILTPLYGDKDDDKRKKDKDKEKR